ncbi:MAG: hypothetical protein CAPSK01_000522 [Candidatus Accumulibacter vicinus]|uniref:Uncharacterized protein n=1 Tax=Candidatus Accumulibacter vicinus TaxID=2954382 RepID=A0A084Y515_9PROT|nr:MAG: hypothetical protein CAPSK01_000522 [Candidatus Accumulibacter vicinus]
MVRAERLARPRSRRPGAELHRSRAGRDHSEEDRAQAATDGRHLRERARGDHDHRCGGDHSRRQSDLHRDHRLSPGGSAGPAGQPAAIGSPGSGSLFRDVARVERAGTLAGRVVEPAQERRDVRCGAHHQCDRRARRRRSPVRRTVFRHHPAARASRRLRRRGRPRPARPARSAPRRRPRAFAPGAGRRRTRAPLPAASEHADRRGGRRRGAAPLAAPGARPADAGGLSAGDRRPPAGRRAERLGVRLGAVADRSLAGARTRSAGQRQRAGGGPAAGRFRGAAGRASGGLFRHGGPTSRYRAAGGRRAGQGRALRRGDRRLYRAGSRLRDRRFRHRPGLAG